MNINEPRVPGEGEGGEPKDDERVEVLVEDLFIEEYQSPLTRAPDQPSAEKAKKARGRLARAVHPIRTNAKSLLAGLFALGGLALVTLLLGPRRRKASRLSRVFSKLGIAR